MRTPLRIGLLLLTTFTGSARAQWVGQPPPQVARGIEAYNRSDFGAAINILKQLVYDFEASEPSGDPDPRAIFYLARMAERGEGMAVDYPLACALLHQASLGFAMRSQTPNLEYSEGAEADVCGRVPDTEEILALETEWFMDGITSTQWAIDGERWVVLDRTGFHVHRGGQEHRIEWNFGIVATRHMRHTEVRFASGKARHFVELFCWQTTKLDGHLQRELIWIPFEIVGTDVAIAGLGDADRGEILTTLDTPYPTGDLPSDIVDGVALTPNDDTGEVEWTISVDSPRRGVIQSQIIQSN